MTTEVRLEKRERPLPVEGPRQPLIDLSMQKAGCLEFLNGYGEHENGNGIRPLLQMVGNSPKGQPPDDYRLLGVETFELDPDVIEGAADQRMAYLRSYQTGPHSARSQKILNEISAARIRLLNAGKKIEYDSFLRQSLSPATDNVPAIGPAFQRGCRPPPGPSQNLDTAVDFGIVISGPTRTRCRQRSKNSLVIWLTAILMWIVGAAVWLGIQQANRPQPIKPSTRSRSAATSPSNSRGLKAPETYTIR